MHRIAATPIGRAPANEVDDDRAHDPRRIGHELHPVCRVQRPGLEQAQVSLVDEAGGIEQCQVAASAQSRMRHLAQVRIQQAEELIDRSGLAAANGSEQRDDVCASRAAFDQSFSHRVHRGHCGRD